MRSVEDNLCQRKLERIWLSLIPADKARLAVQAVLAAPLPFIFSVNFAPEYEPAWKQRRLVRRLQTALQRRVDVLALRGFTRQGRAHLHGVIAALKSSEMEVIDATLRAFAGPWNNRQGRRKYQLHLEPLDPQRWERWTSYIVAQCGFRANDWTMSNDLRAKCKTLAVQQTTGEKKWQRQNQNILCRLPTKPRATRLSTIPNQAGSTPRALDIRHRGVDAEDDTRNAQMEVMP